MTDSDVTASSLTVYPAQFVSAHGCSGAETEVYLLLSASCTRAELDALRELLAAQRTERLAAVELPPLPPAPRWDEEFTGTRSEFLALQAKWRTQEAEARALREGASNRVFTELLAESGVLPYVPLGWYPYYIGDEEDCSEAELKKPGSLASVFERSCRCASVGWWGSDEPEESALPVFLLRSGDASFLARGEISNLDLLLSEVDAQVELLSEKYALERAVVDSYKEPTKEEWGGMSYSEFRVAEKRKTEVQSLKGVSLRSTVEEFRARKRAALLSEQGLFEVLLGRIS